MANKIKRKRRLRKEIKRRPRLIKKVEIEKSDQAIWNIFERAGIVGRKQIKPSGFSEPEGKSTEGNRGLGCRQ